MSQNYQQKYQQLKLVCRRHQATIARLQLEIRERCQNYLLHSSNHKKPESARFDNTVFLESSLPSQDSSKSKSAKSFEDSEPQKECFFEVKGRNVLVISRQVDLTVAEQDSKPIFPLEDRTALIESFKERISILQGNKNELVRQLQKQGNANYELDLRVKSLLKDLETARKEERKARDKLKKLPQFEEKLNQIYSRLAAEAKQQEKQTDSEKQLHEKLDDIVRWIELARMSVQREREQINFAGGETEKKPLEIEKVLTSEFSPMRNSSRKMEAGWTIISKLNQIDIVPVSSRKASGDPNLEEQYQNEIQALQEHNSMFEEELRQSKVELLDVREEAIRSKGKITSLIQLLETSRMERQSAEAQLKHKIAAIEEQLQTSRLDNQQTECKLQLALSQLDSARKQLSAYVQASKRYQQLSASQFKESELEQSKLISQIDSLKQSFQRTDLKKSMNSCLGSPAQPIELEPPYFVEEDLKIDGACQYVKRSFIRKKIVRRNLSATAYRIVSKSREEVDDLISNKLSEYRDKSKEKAARRKVEEQRQKTKSKQQPDSALQRVSEVSEPRDSGIGTGCDLVKVIQVTTRRGKDEVMTAKVYEKGKQTHLSTKRRF